jgi:serine/threonine-protein kinase
VRNGLVEGVTLRAVLRESGAMAPEAAVSVLAGTLPTLAGVHGDVRPENILVDASGGLTVTGFGAPDPGFTPDEPTYLAPERMSGGAATAVADVFAATAVFFECLTGEPPFRAATPEDLHALHEYTQIIVEFAPDELRPLTQRGLAADPADRPESAHDFLTDVDATAIAAYGADWQARGRRLLGAWAAAAATAEGTELAGPDAMPEPPPVGEPIDERWLGLGLEAGASDADASDPDADDAFDDDTDPAADDDLAVGDLLSAFDELAPHSEAAPHSEPAEEPAPEAAPLEAGPDVDPVPAAALLEAEPAGEPVLEDPEAETETETETETDSDSEPEPDTEPDAFRPPSEPRVSPSVQADIDHDWVIPNKPTPQVPRSLSAYANSLPSLPRPAPAESEAAAEPVATSAPDDWFRPGMAEPVDRGPRPTRATTFLNPDKELTAVEAAGFEEEFEEPARAAGHPGGPPRKTLVGAVTAAVLLVAGAAAVVLGGSGDAGPKPAAQSSTGNAAPGTPGGAGSPATPTGSDDSSTQQVPTGGPTSRHTTSRTTSKSKPPSSTTTPPTSHATSQDSSTSHSSSASSASSSETTSSGAASSTPSGSGSSSTTHTTPSSPSSHPSSTDSSTH